MTDRGITQLSIYPEDRGCRRTHRRRVLEIFTSVACHHLVRDGQTFQTFQPELTELQRQVFDLLDIPASHLHTTP